MTGPQWRHHWTEETNRNRNRETGKQELGTRNRNWRNTRMVSPHTYSLYGKRRRWGVIGASLERRYRNGGGRTSHSLAPTPFSRSRSRFSPHNCISDVLQPNASRHYLSMKPIFYFLSHHPVKNTPLIYLSIIIIKQNFHSIIN